MHSFSLEQEADILGTYLLKQSPNSLVKTLYAKAIQKASAPVHINDQKLLKFILRQNWSIGLVDSGLAFMNPSSEVRRRIYIMFAILESMPDYYDRYLPKHRAKFYLFVIAFTGIQAVIKALIGSVLIKIII